MRFKAVVHWGILAAAILVASVLPFTQQALAAVAGDFTLGAGEEYNDNIFFSNEGKDKDKSDFITHIVPTFKFIYAPLGAIAPTLNASLSASGEIYARNSDLNNFGKNIIGNVGYSLRPTARTYFHIADSFNREGATRTIGLEAFAGPPQLPPTPTQMPPSGAFVALPTYQDIGGLVTKGTNLSNYITVEGAYLYAPTLTFSGLYANGYSNSGGVGQVSNTAGVRGVYNWRRDHNLFVGYSVTILTTNSRSAKSHNASNGTEVIHNIDIGDDYLSGFKIQLDPTWTISASAGLGINTAGGGPGLGTNVNVTMIKLWERAVFNLAVRRGFTGSYGISTEPALTTTFSSGFGVRITENLTGLMSAEYSLFETKDADFKVFRTATGLQWWVTPWLSSNLWYSYRFRDAGNGAGTTNLASTGVVRGNAVVATAAVYFDLYPNFRLARGSARPIFSPMGAPVYMGTEQQRPSTTEPSGPSPLQ